MPIYEIKCNDCGRTGEVLVTSTGAPLVCPDCDGTNTEKLMSQTSSLTGQPKQSMPGPGDHTCCGSSPGQAAGCAGPGSCCGGKGM